MSGPTHLPTHANTPFTHTQDNLPTRSGATTDMCTHPLRTRPHTLLTHQRMEGRHNQHAHTCLCPHTSTHLWAHTLHTQAGTHTWTDTLLFPHALTCVSPHTSTHMQTSKTHTHMSTHTSHTSGHTQCTHTMHTHFTHKWEHAASFRSICFKAGALSCVGRVCVRMSEFFKFITHSLHDTPGFITILLFPCKVLPLLRTSRVITTNINT